MARETHFFSPDAKNAKGNRIVTMNPYALRPEPCAESSSFSRPSRMRDQRHRALRVFKYGHSLSLRALRACWGFREAFPPSCCRVC